MLQIRTVLNVLTTTLFGSAGVLGTVVLLNAVGVINSRPATVARAEAKANARILDSEEFYKLVSEGRRIGPEDAPVTIVVFSNYSCGHCTEFERTLNQLRERYPDHVAIVVKHLVQSGVRSQLVVHEAAECAADQGHFAEFNHAAFQRSQLPTLHDEWLPLGDSSGVPDMRRFATCVRSGRYAGVIARDTEEARRLGVEGTPTSFINGVRAIGTVSLESLDSFVATELGRSHRTN